MESLQNIHRLIAVSIKREMQGAEGAGVVELGEIDLVGEAGGGSLCKPSKIIQEHITID